MAKTVRPRENLFTLLLRRGREERVAQTAGALSFTTAISMVPLLAVSFALFARVPALRGIGETLREHLLRGLLPVDITRTVLKYLGQFTGNAGALTLAGSAALLLSTLLLLLSVETTLNRIWQAKKPRPLHRRLALYLALVLAGPLAVGASWWATSSVLAGSGPWGAPKSPWTVHPATLAAVAVGTAAFGCLFRFVPHLAVRWRDAVAGGLLAAIAFEVGKHGFAVYLAHVPTYRAVYGAFAPLLAFLAWVYYSWLVTLAAALVSAGLGRGRGAGSR